MFTIFRLITDLIVSGALLENEGLNDERRAELIDQFIQEIAVGFDLRDLGILLIVGLIIYFWRAWDRANR